MTDPVKTKQAALLTPSPREPIAQAGADYERGDWFYDELMTPQPDATQAYFRERLKQLAKDHQNQKATKQGG